MEKKRILFFSLLAFYIFITISSNLFHEDNTRHPLDQCAVCAWQMTTIALASLYFLVILIYFTILCLLYFYNDKIRFSFPFYHYCRRAPPWIQ